MELMVVIFRALLALSVSLTPVASLSQANNAEASLEKCQAEIKKIVGSQSNGSEFIDMNFAALSDCLTALETSVERQSIAAEQARQDAELALNESQKVSQFEERVNSLTLGPRSAAEFQLAQSMCVGLAQGKVGWISSVPRLCDKTTSYSQNIDCNAICSQTHNNSTDKQRQTAKTRSCVNSIHIYKDQPVNTTGKTGLKTYVYGSCSVKNCGPNYCCCSSL
jgi:hypothetical protein